VGRPPVRRADNLANFMCGLSGNLGVSTSWKPQGLSMSVMGLIYLNKKGISTYCYEQHFVVKQFGVFM
jgi:hypothetical protein